MIVLLSLLSSTPAAANGQSTHVWISKHALEEHLPDGELADLLSDPHLHDVMVNGTMFPDGGYPLGDGYAEIAHWEPFQNRYRDWIRERCTAPWTDECAEHVAFLLGMSSHGMADQVFDALYYQRGLQHDHESDFGAHSFDQATDVVFMSMVGRVDYPDDWVPYDTFVDLYAAHGHEVEADTMMDGQNLLRVAILWVGNASEDETLTAAEASHFPWLTSHLDDPDVPGNPPCEGEVLAAYWKSVYARVQGDLAFSPQVIASFPKSGFGLETDATRVESRISLVFSQAIDSATVSDERIVVTDPDGQVVPTSAWLYYGDDSHVLHIQPAQDWAEDTAYTVTVGAGVATIDGNVTDGSVQLVVSTAAPPADPGGADSGDAEATPTTGGGKCSGAPVGLFLLAPVLGLGRRRGVNSAPRRATNEPMANET